MSISFLQNISIFDNDLTSVDTALNHTQINDSLNLDLLFGDQFQEIINKTLLNQNSYKWDDLNKVKKLTFTHQNLRSLNNKFNEVYTRLVGSRVDFNSYSETWLSGDTTANEIDIPGYNLIRVDREHKGGGGVCLYYKSNRQVDVVYNKSCQNSDILFVEISLTRCRKTYLGIVYKPPDSNVDILIDTLSNILESLPINSDIILMGDFNVDASTINLNSWKKLYDTLSSFNLFQQIKEATRITNKTETLIDHIWVNNYNLFNKSGVIRMGTSDHDLIYTIRDKLPNQRFENTTFTYRDLNNYDPISLKHLLDNFAWGNFYLNDNTDSMWEILLGAYYQALDILAPQKTLTNVKCKNNWVSKESLKLIHLRDNLKLAHSKCKNKTEKAVIWENFKKIRNLTNKQINKDKKAHIRNNLEKTRKNKQYKEYWGILLNLTGRGKSKNNRINIKKDNTTLSDIDQANLLNDHFADIGLKLIGEAQKLSAHMQQGLPNEDIISNYPEFNQILQSLIDNGNITKSEANILQNLFGECGSLVLLKKIFESIDYDVTMGSISLLFENDDSTLNDASLVESEPPNSVDSISDIEKLQSPVTQKMQSSVIEDDSFDWHTTVPTDNDLPKTLIIRQILNKFRTFSRANFRPINFSLLNKGVKLLSKILNGISTSPISQILSKGLNTRMRSSVPKLVTKKSNLNGVVKRRLISNSKTSYKNFLKSKSRSSENICKTDFVLHEFSVKEVWKQVKKISIHKSTAITNINGKLLKDCLLHTLPQLTHLFNKIIQTNRIPQSWKESIVVPLHKGGDKSNINNYRPISLLPTPVKILEKLIGTKIVSFLEEAKLFNPNQGGFRRKMSTGDTIFQLLKYCYFHLNNRNPVHLIFYDLTKAFDTVDHHLLLYKLKNFKLYNIIPLIQNYLYNRKQITIANGILSDKRNITCGVPQGSILGPLLFLLFINDMPDVIQNSGIKLYADDAVLYYSSSSITNTINIQKENNIRIAKWCAKNNLTISCVKTKCMWITGKLKIDTFDHKINIYDKEIGYTDDFKYLGLWLDKQLTFDKHIDILKKKIYKQSGAVKRCRKYLSTKQCIFLYKTLVLPLFDYVDIFYNSSSAKNLNQLQTLQNRLLRSCYRKKDWPGTQAAHKENNILNLDLRRRLHLSQHALKLTKQKSNIKIFKRAKRKNGKLYLNKIKSKYKFIDNSIIIKAPDIWNNLPDHIRKLSSKEDLTCVLTEFLWQDQLATQ